VFANPPVGDEDAFNDWYDEHAAARLGVPGVLNARRYQAVAEDGPRYMASYDLDTVETLQRSEYVRLNAERSARERDMLARLRMLDRRVLKLVLGTDAWTEDAPYQFAVGLEPSAGAEEDLIAWCREEHIPLLLQVPGWRRVRLFQQVEGSGPAFVALHEVESPAVFQSEAYRHSISTAWRDRIMGSLSRQEQHLFKLLRSFPLPTWGAA